jgi:uncharacterized protein with HEPN domain
MSFEPRDYLLHILAEADFLLEASAGLTFPGFDSDETLRGAFVRSVAVIGEASKKVSQTFRDLHPEIEWRSMAGMRDRLIHDYMGVDYELVWDVIQNRIPELKKQIGAVLKP